MILKQLVGAAVAFGLSVSVANAATASLLADPTDPASGVIAVNPGAIITVSLVVDLAADQSLGGGFDLNWCTGCIDFIGSTVTAPGSDPFFTRPGDEGPGTLTGVAFGSFNGYSGEVLAAELTFEVIGAAGTTTFINLGPNSVPAGPLVDFSGIPLDVMYNGLEVQIVPIPAAAWLLLGGLGMLFGFRRQR